jgi:hypothetical protein
MYLAKRGARYRHAYVRPGNYYLDGIQIEVRPTEHVTSVMIGDIHSFKADVGNIPSTSILVCVR